MREYILNGERKSFIEGDTLASLITQKDLDLTVLVVEHNGNIIETTQLASVFLRPSDVVEIIHFVGGG